MFNYLFPIFCFGLAVSGVVILGLVEAASRSKVDSEQAQPNEPPSGQIKAVPSPVVLVPSDPS